MRILLIAARLGSKILYYTPIYMYIERAIIIQVTYSLY